VSLHTGPAPGCAAGPASTLRFSSADHEAPARLVTCGLPLCLAHGVLAKMRSTARFDGRPCQTAIRASPRARQSDSLDLTIVAAPTARIAAAQTIVIASATGHRCEDLRLRGATQRLGLTAWSRQDSSCARNAVSTAQCSRTPSAVFSTPAADRAFPQADWAGARRHRCSVALSYSGGREPRCRGCSHTSSSSSSPAG